MLMPLLPILGMVSGSDVVVGVLGKPAFIECQLPVSDTLVLEVENSGIIAMNGKLLDDNSTKYAI